jgi:4-hydroxybenzoate polyprenyltransferase
VPIALPLRLPVPPATAPNSSAPAPVAGAAALAAIARDIKLSHSVFALPFALLASVLVLHARGQDGPIPPLRLALLLAIIVLCMVSARTFAMVVNRVADRKIDAGHVRTKARAFAAGRVGLRAGVATMAACAALFVGCAALLGVVEGNWLPTLLALPVLGLLALYSFTKRFTAFCHLVLGVCLACSPLCAAVALHPQSLHPGSPSHQPALWLLSCFVLCWVAGFDIIYALQDQHYDRSKGLHSIPAALGTTRSVWASRVLHALALGALAGVLVLEPRFGWCFGVGLGLVAGLLLWEHAILTKLVRTNAIDPASPPPALNMAFFTLNGVVSCVVGVLGIADVLLV